MLCDGATPKCGQCRSKDLDCHYETGKDKRKLALRKVIEVCSERIQQLESYIESFDKEVPLPLSAESATLLVEVQATITAKQNISNESNKNSLDQSTLVFNNDPGVAFRAQQQEQNQEHDHRPGSDCDESCKFRDNIPFEPPGAEILNKAATCPLPDIGDFMDFQGLEHDAFDWSWSATEEEVFLKSISTVPFPSINESGNDSTHASAETGIRTDQYDPFDDESDSEIIEELSVRLGDLQIVDDGTLRYFGPTSNMTLSPAVTLYNFGQAQKMDTQQKHVRAEDVISPMDLNRFLNLYFSWQNSFLPLVDREVFEDSLNKLREGQDVAFCSEPLKFSISALGAILDSGSRAAVPNSTAQTFADHAISLLEADYDRPQIATVQSFAILSCYEAIRTRDARGWLYAGMAMRLALDLGLHVDTTSFLLAGKMTSKIARARRTAFWGTYIIDQLWSFYLGRPLVTQIYEISNSPPMVDHKESEQFWIPYRTSPAEVSIPAGPFPSCPSTVFVKSFVTLCQEISALASKLYGSIRASNDELMELAEKTFHSLQHWKATLGPQLSFDRVTDNVVPAPHILLLHVQYHVFVIILHRPFVSKSATQPYPLRGEGPFHAREMCVKSALEIAKLLQLYETTYTLSIVATPVVHAAFSAALILVYATISQTNISTPADLSGDLATCCRVLSILGSRFESATRALDTLLAIKRKWQSILVVGAGRKRSSSRQPNDALIALRKKLRSRQNTSSPHGFASGSEDGSIAQQLVEFPTTSNTDVLNDKTAVMANRDRERLDEQFHGISMP